MFYIFFKPTAAVIGGAVALEEKKLKKGLKHLMYGCIVEHPLEGRIYTWHA
jgi:hypothetical protein